MFTHSGKTVALGLLSAATFFHAPLFAQSVKTQIQFAQATVGIAANSFTDKIYVAAPSYGGATDTLSVIDGKSDTISANITVPRGAQLPVVDLLRNTVFVVGCDFYSTNFNCIVTKVDGKTNKVINTETVTTTEGDGIIGAAYDPICEKLYLANGSNFRIDVIDGRDLKVVDAISTNGQEPFGISLNPLNHRLYVPYYSNQVQVFDAYTKALLDTATFGSQDVATAVNWFTGNVFVSDNVFGPSTEGVLDKNGVVLATPSVSETPYNLDVDLLTNKAYVLSTGIPALNVIDGKTNTVTATLQGINASYISVDFFSHKVYISGNSGVTVVTE